MNKIRYITIVILIILGKYTFCQNLSWVNHFGGISYDLIYDVDHDSLGFRYVIGAFTNTINVECESGTSSLNSYGSNDIFVGKLNNIGQFVWINQIGSKQHDLPTKINVDINGNIIVIGEFIDTAIFRDNIDTTYLINHGIYPNQDIFFAKYDNSGKLLWVNSIGGKNQDRPTDITSDILGNLYVTGWFRYTAYFDSMNNDSLKAKGFYDTFLAKYKSNGDFVWVKQIKASNSGSIEAISFFNNELYLTGYFWDTLYINPNNDTILLINKDQSADIFVSKFDSLGNYIFAFNLEGSSISNDICLDNFGNIYITGSYVNKTDFDPSQDSVMMTSKGYSDIFIAKYDNYGNYIWANGIGGKIEDEGLCIKAINDKLFICGYFHDTVDFNAGVDSLPIYGTPNNKNAFVTCYDTSGSYEWVDYIYGNSSFSALDFYNNNMFIVGGFGNNINYHDSILLTSNGNMDALALMYQFDLPTINLSPQKVEKLYLYPNPTDGNVIIESDFTNIKKISIIDLNGKVFETNNLINEKCYDLSKYKSGIYLMDIEVNNRHFIRKLILNK